MTTYALITGDRYALATKWAAIIEKALRDHHVDEVIEGGAAGIDMIAGSVATSECLPVHSFPADWKAHGRAAGPIRNTEMLRFLQERIAEGHTGVVLAFHPHIEQSKGTRNMVKQARDAGLTVYVYDGAGR